MKTPWVTALLSTAMTLGCEQTPPPPAATTAASAPPTGAADASATGSARAAGFDDSMLAKSKPGKIIGQILGPEREPLPDVVVYLPATDDDPKRATGTVARLDQKNKTFLPKVLPVQVGTTVELRNSDAVLHNVYSRSEAKTFDVGSFGRDEVKTVELDTPGRVDVLCAMHTNMYSVIYVVETPHFALTDERGYFELAAPSGDQVVQLWHDVYGKAERPATTGEGVGAVIRHVMVDG